MPPFLVVVLLLLLGLHQSLACNSLSIPTDVDWTNPLISYRNWENNSWTPVDFHSSKAQVNTTNNSITTRCDYDGIRQKSVCALFDTNRTNALIVGPFFEAVFDIEYSGANTLNLAPDFTFQKRFADYKEDTVLIQLLSERNNSLPPQTKMRIRLDGPSPLRHIKTSDFIPALVGRHIVTLLWDNYTILGKLDGVELARMSNQDKLYWPVAEGYIMVYLTYEDPYASNPTEISPDRSYIIVHSINITCIDADLTLPQSCKVANPLPTYTDCDIITGIWHGTGDVETLDALNVSSIAVEINGSLTIGGTVHANEQTQVTVNGTLLFAGGVLVLEIPSRLLDNENASASIILFNYTNYTGAFDNMTTVIVDNASPCVHVASTPVYTASSFSVLLQVDRTACSSKRRANVFIAAVICVLVAVIAAISVILLLVFVFPSSRLLQPRRKTRTATMNKELRQAVL